LTVLCPKSNIQTDINNDNKGVKTMKFPKQLLFIPIFSAVCGAHAATPLLDSDLNDQTIYAGAAITTGAGSTVGGNLQAIEAVTLGAGSKIGANLVAGAAITLGASATVGNNVTAGMAITLGANAEVGGDLLAGAGPITVGGLAQVTGNVTHATNVTLSATSSVGGAVEQGTFEDYSNNPNGPLDNQKIQLEDAQAALNLMYVDTELATTLTVDTTFEPGVYHAAGLSTTAGITITLDGNDETNLWVFNIDSYMAFGANTTIELLNVTSDSTIIWNTGTYTTIGAGANVIGTFIAGTYATTGAGTTLAGIDDACGAIFATTEAVTLGTDNTMGALGCRIGAVNNILIEEDGTAVFVISDDILIEDGQDGSGGEDFFGEEEGQDDFGGEGDQEGQETSDTGSTFG
jgi:cytoskeletal protein CcmA (bactofilin family)